MIVSTFLPVCDRPDDKYLNKYVKEKVCGAGKWLDLGTELMGGDAISTLNVISINHPNDVEKCCSVMFTKWKQQKPKANWKNLIDALREIKLDQLASELEGLLIPSVVSNGKKLEECHLPSGGNHNIMCRTTHDHIIVNYLMKVTIL